MTDTAPQTTTDTTQEPTMPNVYVAGPMRGKPDFNFPAFDDATLKLKALGYSVFSPADHDRSNGFQTEGLTGHESLTERGFDLREALRADTEYIATTADAILLLDGWQQSSGARAELALAAALGLDAAEGFGPDGQPAWMPAQEVFAGKLGIAPTLPSGEVRMTSATGGQKGSKEARFDLIPAGPLTTLARLYGRGALKYDDDNWRKGYDWRLSFAAMQRHAWQFWGGQNNDDETGLPHLASVAWHAFALLEFMQAHPQYDSRFAAPDES